MHCRFTSKISSPYRYSKTYRDSTTSRTSSKFQVLIGILKPVRGIGSGTGSSTFQVLIGILKPILIISTTIYNCIVNFKSL